MPKYDYKCTHCGEQIKKKCSKASRTDFITCKKCGGEMQNIPKILSSPAPNFHRKRKNQSANTPRGGGMRIKGGATVQYNCFTNLDVGISMSDEAKVQMRGNIFRNVNFPIEVRND